MGLGPEYEQVEKPLIRQLVGMGWTHLEGASPGSVKPEDPAKSGRSSFSEVLLTERLRSQIRTLNRDQDGRPWLDDERIDQAVAALTRIAAPSLLEGNKTATELLIEGFTVEGLPDWDGGREQTIQYIGWNAPLGNDFVVVSQFRVNVPGTQGRRCILPDEVLFVNGIPLALVECKKPGEGLAEAVRQHQRYADRRRGPGTMEAEGNPRLFHTVQLLIATSGDRAMLGSITSGPEHYAPWADPYPLSTEELAERLGKSKAAVSAQDILTGVVLDPVRLLDIVRNYVTFMETDEGTTIKAVPRYQQYRAVRKAVDRLEHGKTRKQSSNDKDKRGGIIWHTQGSGKSLTMSFLVRTLRTVPSLRTFKIIVVTDRTQLQDQLATTMKLAGEKVDVANKMTQARRYLSQHGPGVVFVMIQKQQDENAGKRKSTDDIFAGTVALPPELNTDEDIVVLIDEAHRSHTSKLHATLMAALPNCARIGFTGTPIVTGIVEKQTWHIFGDYIDLYRLADAERDGAVVPIFYRGMAVKGAVRDGRDMDEVFEDMLAGHTPSEMEEIKRRYATKGDVLEAEKLIAAKAKNMLHHYVAAILPNGFKAQVAVHSREATVRYRTAFRTARDDLVAQIEGLPEAAQNADPESLPTRTAYLVRAAKHLHLIKAIDFAPVISVGTTNDEKHFEPWTDPSHQKQVIKDFTSPFPDPAELASGRKTVAFLLVKSMLLTGFDAPVEQTLYLDRTMQGAELLQAIARVNRPAKGKECGYVIDYVGVTNHLTSALRAYSAADVQGVLTVLNSQADNLEPQLRRVTMVFTDHGVQPGLSDDAKEACVELLADGQLRDLFDNELRTFLATIDTVLPEPAALRFLDAAKLFAEIATRARRRYRLGGDFDPSLYGAKVRELIDEHMISLGVESVLPPVSITDPEYQKKIARLGSRARASDMEHAIRHHIGAHLDQDPVRYRALSERLERILAEHAGNWEQLAFSLNHLLDEMSREDDPGQEQAGSPGRNRVESALYGLLAEETAIDGLPDTDFGQRLGVFSSALCKLAVTRTKRRDFWRRPVDQNGFVSEITVSLIDAGICAPAEAPALADKLFEIIRANRGWIQQADV